MDSLLNIVLLTEVSLTWEARGIDLIIFENTLPPCPLLFLMLGKVACLCLTRL